MKDAILGGSFNPVHLGHLFLAEAVLAAGYDRIILVPAFQSPFKIGAEGASPEDRLEMLCASVCGDSRFTVDDCEIRREGVSYTVDTVFDIKKRYLPDGKPGLVLGDDLLESFHLWRSSAQIAEETDLIIARRLAAGSAAANTAAAAGSAAAANTETAAETANNAGFVNPETPGDFNYPHTRLKNDLLDISSRQVREKIRAGDHWQFLVPPGARCIIEDRNLYGCDTVAAYAASSVKNIRETTVIIENAARNTLDLHRFTHSRHTALFARDLCIKYGQDPDLGYLAGIAHDLCKLMDAASVKLLAGTDGFKISAHEQKKPSLLHGRAAAVLLRTRYGINDKDLLEAVRWHVTGGIDTCPLAKIIYIADKIEVSRYWVDPQLREMSRYAGLDDFFEAVMSYTAGFLDKSGTAL
ncbi:MAG: nicotinate (nicotinamide) nucleotide adenylyltransferase [Treponema sp.]|nr:nicotinate (nicotinamide) nucleotide adenylyltransferase [Treponema sp.]